MNTKECLRCGGFNKVSAIGAKLFNYVCDHCRTQRQDWDFNKHRGDGITVEDMEFQTPLPEGDENGFPEDDEKPRAHKQFVKNITESIIPEAHKNHQVLGDYCWNCQVRTSNKMPGWSSPYKDTQTHRIRWADGSTDNSDTCDMCGRRCHKPVHMDYYKEVSKRVI
jgi:hypothetical protein